MSGNWIQQKTTNMQKFIVIVLLAIINALLITNLRFADYWIEDSQASVSLAVAYSLILLSLFSRNERARTAFLALGSLALGYTALPSFPDFYSRGAVYEFFGTDAWSITVLQVFGLLIFITSIIFARKGYKVLADSVKQFFNSLTQYGSKLISFVLLLGIVALLVGLIYDVASSFNVSQEELEYSRYFYDQVQLILFSILALLVSFFGSALLSPMLVKLVKGFKSWWSVTIDFSINQYLTRRIAAAFFTLVFYSTLVVIALVGPIAIFVGLELADSITFIGYLGSILIFPIGLLISLIFWVLIVVVVRLVYEVTNAVIHIAENTTIK